ncbi:hypothetical protein ARMSODRAFT_1011579 [Armillaria solidipes]|uniref:Uncharacterized protein n=1 Tax=Armillaria solidipes TaxID=1076256 RepID=A0A2H3CAP1_9AGAR|nr:hypothetical protein ARMSODRAFT_1011579 [Armillaria solidipes]
MTSHQVLPIKLDDDKKFNGKNWATFEIVMMTEGNTHGLVNYWENKVTIPGATLAPLPSTPINSLTSNLLEYAQHESVALASIIRNVKDMFGIRIDPHKPFHMFWEILKTDYSAYLDLIHNCREKMLKAVNTKKGRRSVVMEDTLKECGNFERKPTMQAQDSVISTLCMEKNLTVVIAHIIAYSK